MMHPVVKRSLFEECGIKLGETSYTPEDTTESYLIEKIIMANAEWLTRDKTGTLIGYDPETHIQIGCRLVLNCNNEVSPEDIFWVNLDGDEKSTFHELLQNGVDAAVILSSMTTMYSIQEQTLRGWTMGKDVDGKPVALCRNFVFAVGNIVRRGK